MEKLIIPNVFETSIAESLNWLNSLKSPFICVEDLKIPVSTQLLWSKHKLFPIQTAGNAINERVPQFNLYDWVWFQILNDLTKMGISLETAKSIKTAIFQNFDTGIVNGMKIPKETFKKLYPGVELNLNAFSDVITIDETVLNLFPSINLIELLVFDALLINTDISLLYRFDGFLGFLKNSRPISIEGAFEYDILGVYNKEFVSAPHICIPINKYVKTFIAGYTDLKDCKFLAFVSENEREVLNTLQENNLKQLTIKLNQTNKTIKEIEYVKDRDVNTEELYSILRSKSLKNQFGVNIRHKGYGGFYYEELTKRKFE